MATWRRRCYKRRHPRRARHRRRLRGRVQRGEGPMRSIFFTMMSYPELPEPDETYSSWVTPQQKWWDAQVGHAVYNKYLNELEYADAVGFDAIGMNEHHNCA